MRSGEPRLGLSTGDSLSAREGKKRRSHMGMGDTPKTNPTKAYVSLQERVAVEQLRLVASCDAAEQ